MKEISEEELEGWVKKASSLTSGMDLSSAEDLSIGLMNLISLEEHLYFSAMKTNEEKYLHMLDAIREIRKKVMGQLVKNPQGEEWCVSKHLLAASMRLIETGVKERGQGKHDQANVLFHAGFNLYSLFFAIIMRTHDSMPAMEYNHGKKSNTFEDPKQQPKFLSTIAAIVKKVVDCCRE